MEKLKFITYPDGIEEEFYVVADTRINATNYLLVAEDDSDEAVSFILKDHAEDSETESNYEIVEDETELQAVAEVFKELLEDYDIE